MTDQIAVVVLENMYFHYRKILSRMLPAVNLQAEKFVSSVAVKPIILYGIQAWSSDVR